LLIDLVFVGEFRLSGEKTYHHRARLTDAKTINKIINQSEFEREKYGC